MAKKGFIKNVTGAITGLALGASGSAMAHNNNSHPLQEQDHDFDAPTSLTLGAHSISSAEDLSDTLEPSHAPTLKELTPDVRSVIAQEKVGGVFVNPYKENTYISVCFNEDQFQDNLDKLSFNDVQEKQGVKRDYYKAVEMCDDKGRQAATVLGRYDHIEVNHIFMNNILDKDSAADVMQDKAAKKGMEISEEEINRYYENYILLALDHELTHTTDINDEHVHGVDNADLDGAEGHAQISAAIYLASVSSSAEEYKKMLTIMPKVTSQSYHIALEEAVLMDMSEKSFEQLKNMSAEDRLNMAEKMNHFANEYDYSEAIIYRMKDMGLPDEEISKIPQLNDATIQEFRLSMDVQDFEPVASVVREGMDIEDFLEVSMEKTEDVADAFAGMSVADLEFEKLRLERMAEHDTENGDIQMQLMEIDKKLSADQDVSQSREIFYSVEMEI